MSETKINDRRTTIIQPTIIETQSKSEAALQLPSIAPEAKPPSLSTDLKSNEFMTQFVENAYKSELIISQQREKCEEISFDPKKDIKILDQILDTCSSMIDNLVSIANDELSAERITAESSPLEVDNFATVLQKFASMSMKAMAERRKLAGQIYGSPNTQASPLMKIFNQQINNFPGQPPKKKSSNVLLHDDEDEDMY